MNIDNKIKSNALSSNVYFYIIWSFFVINIDINSYIKM